MLRRTWPYGTIKKVGVTHINSGKHNDRNIVVTVVYDESEKESYMLVGDKNIAVVGDQGTITFKEGGPMGGYWDFVKD